MYIKVPEAMILCGLITQEEADTIAYRLDKSMYGNVDAAFRFFITFKKIMLELGCIQSKADPCVFYRLDKDGVLELICGSHVDDTLTAGRKFVIDKFLDEFHSHLAIERLGKLKKHLGVWWDWKLDSDGMIYLEARMDKMKDAIIAQYTKR